MDDPEPLDLEAARKIAEWDFVLLCTVICAKEQRPDLVRLARPLMDLTTGGSGPQSPTGCSVDGDPVDWVRCYLKRYGCHHEWDRLCAIGSDSSCIGTTSFPENQALRIGVRILLQL